MAKMAILKPIMWNPDGYKGPAGYPSTSGYSREHGFGHEEWNNDDGWRWNGWRVFHTEGNEILQQAARTGDLGMVMIAACEGKTYAVGIATNVFLNAPKEVELIVKAVRKDEQVAKVWQLETVRRSFASREAFTAHWRSTLASVQWRCLPEHYYWFRKEIPLVPERVTGKQKFAMRHSKYTKTSPDVLFDIVDGHLPRGCFAIRDWLSSGEFSRKTGQETEGQKAGAEKRYRYRRRGGNAPTDRRFEYWVKGDRAIEPLHDRLQKLWVKYLKDKGFVPEENKEYVDVQYVSSGTRTLCEVKPTDNLPTRYAIRLAVGQLLEYRYRNQVPDAALQIVIGGKPGRDEIGFVKSLNMKLAYFDKSRGEFVNV
jgi:hypothetical protein